MCRCQNCPVTDESLPCRAGVFCDWMGATPPDPVHVKHIIAVSLKDAGRPLPPQDAIPCDETTVIHAAPGFLQKAVNFGKAIVTHAVAGFPEADDATFRDRIAACRACEFSSPEPLTCLKCGCGMEIKARWDDQRCPIGKW